MTSDRWPGVAVAVVCALLAMFLALNARDASLVREANQAGREGRFDAAIAKAEQVSRRPAELKAVLARARAHTAKGQRAQADRAWAEAARRDPNNWIVHYERARALARLGDQAEGRRAYLRARELNPRLPALPGR